MSNNDQQLEIFQSVNDSSNMESQIESNIRYEGALTTEDGNSQRNLNNSISIVSTINENTRISVSVYGNDIKLENPLKIGKCYSFLYFRGLPLITLGPECKIKLIVS